MNSDEIFWNIENSQKITGDNEIKEFLNKFEVIALQETWAQKCPQIIGYTAMYKEAKKEKKYGRYAGGICIYVKKQKKWRIQEIKNNLTDSIWVRIIAEEEEIIIGNVYRHPNDSCYYNEDFYKELQETINETKMKFERARVIVGGDFNSRVGTEKDITKIHSIQNEWEKDEEKINNNIPPRANEDKIVNAAGKKLLRVCKSTGLIIINGKTSDDVNGKFTYISKQGSSTIDLVLIRKEDYSRKKINLKVGERMESKHQPIKVTVEFVKNMREIRETNEKGRMERYVWNENKVRAWEENYKGIKALMWQIGISQAIKHKNIGNGLMCLEKLLKTLGQQMKINNKDNSATKKIKFTRGMKIKKKTAKRSLRTYRRERTRENLEKYLKERKKYKKLLSEAKKLTIEKEKREVKKAIETKNDKQFWRIIKNNRRNWNQMENNVSEEAWIRYYENLYSTRVVEGLKNENKGKNINARREGTNQRITKQEVEKVIKGTKRGKATGIDGIPAEFYKKLGEEKQMMEYLAELFNLILEKKKWPDEWKTGIVVPIYKKGDKERPENYRPITLLPVISKIFTKIIGERLQKWMVINKSTSELQTGFKAGHSTIDNLIILNAIIEKTIKKKNLYACFIDLKAAFDNVEKSLLWKTLEEKELPDNTIQIIKEIYKEVKCCVRQPDGRLTREFKTEKGVRQGCQLSAFLFILFIDELVEKIKEKNTHPPCIGKLEIPILMYADDIVLLTESKVGIKRALKGLEEFCTEKKTSGKHR